MQNRQPAKPCRICLGFDTAPGAVQAQILEYLESLQAAVRVEQAEWERRLQICEACTQRAGHTCLCCGCYVQVRAAKWAVACPNPSGAKWGRGTPAERE